MQPKTILIIAFVGLFCVVNVQSQSDWRQLLPKSLSDGAKKVIDAIFKLQTDLAKMRSDKKYDGTLLKADIDAIVAAGDENSIPISDEARTKINDFTASLDKMIKDNKFDPKAIREGVFGILKALRPSSITG